MSSSNDGILKVCFALIGGGSYFFYKGLLNFKLQQRIKDIPRSKISSAAIGSNIEIHGKVVSTVEESITSPFTKKKCSAFIWNLQELTGHGKNKEWRDVYTFYSTPFLYIQDESTHFAAVDLSSCEFQEGSYDHEQRFTDRNFDLPDKVKVILKKSKMLNTDETSSFFNVSTFRLRERAFFYDQPIFAIGSARPVPKTEKAAIENSRFKYGSREVGLKKKIMERLRLYKSDRDTILKYDKNSNSILDLEEEKKMYQDIESDILLQFGMNAVNPYLANSKLLLTSDTSAKEIFNLNKVYLSHKHEDLVVRGLKLKAFLGIIGGPILISIGIYMFLNFMF